MTSHLSVAATRAHDLELRRRAEEGRRAAELRGSRSWHPMRLAMPRLPFLGQPATPGTTESPASA